MAKMVFDCDYCDNTFSTLGEAEIHEREHYKARANLSCEKMVFIKDTEKGSRQKFCCRKCGNLVKQQAFRVRHDLDFILN